MKDKKYLLIVLAIFIVVMFTGCAKKDKEEPQKENVTNQIIDEEPIQFKLVLDKYYSNGTDSKLYLNSDGTFKLEVCDKKKKCTKYKGVLDHADNGIIFYYEKRQKPSSSWKKYKKIVNGEVIDDNVLKIGKSTYKVVEK